MAEKLAATGDALRQLLIGPLFRSSGGLNTKNLSDILAAMIPTIFTGLGVCVMFSANEFNLGVEGGALLGAFVAAMCAIYVPMAAGVHMAFAFPMVRILLLAFSLNNVRLFLIVTLIAYGIFAVLYTAVYAATSRAYYGIVSGGARVCAN